MTQTRTRKRKGIEARPAQTGDSDERTWAEERAQLCEAVVNAMQVGLNVWQLEAPDDLGSFRLVVSNPAAGRATDVPREEVLGKTMAERYPSFLKTELPAVFAQVIRSGTAVDLGEVRYGDERIAEGVFSVKAFPLPNRCVGVAFESITERKRVEEALRESEERFRKLAEDSIDGIVLVEGLEVRFANAALVKMLGYENDKGVVGQPFTDFVSAEYRELMLERGRARDEGRDAPGRYEFRALRKDGSELDGEISVSDVRYGGKQARQGVIRDITERKGAEEALRDSERRYRLLADNVTDLIWTTDLKLHPTHASPSISRLLGYTVEEAMALSLKEVLTPASFDLVREVYAEEISGKSVEQMDPHRSRRMELEVVRKDGSVIWVEANMTFLRDPNGRAVGVLGVSRDVTERKRTEEALRESEEKYRRLVEDSLDGIVIARGLEVMFANRAVLEVLGLQSEEEIIGRPFTDFVSPDYRELMVERGLARERGGSFPVRYEFKGLRGDGTEVDAEISAGSIVYEGEVARQGIIRDITERKRAEQALRESESRYRLLAENVTDVIWTADLNLNLTYISPSAARLWGYSIEERMAMRLVDLLTPASVEVARRAYADAMARGARNENVPRSPVTLEMEVRHKDGSTAWAEVTVTFLRDPDGQPVGILGVSREITERKRAQEALRQSESRYRLLAENATDVIWTTNMDLNLTYVSPSVEQTWGYTAEERMGMRLEQLLTPASLDVARRAFRETLAIAKKGGRGLSKLRTVVLEIHRKDASAAWAEVKMTVLRDPDGRPVGLLGASRDITERKRAEEGLRESEARFRTLAESAPAAIFIFQGRKFLYVNPMAEALSGYTREELLALDSFDLLRPEFQKRLTELGEARLRGNRDAVRAEFEFVRKDGEARWVDVTGDAIEYGGEVAGIGIAYDVTERKRAEEALRKSEAKFRKLADSPAAAVFIYRGTRPLYVNAAMEELTGYSQEEILARELWQFVHPDFQRLVRERSRTRQQGEEAPSRYELKIVRKSGEERWVDFTAAMIEFEGAPAALGTAYDVTERKHAEEALSESEERFRSLADAAFEGAAIHHKGTILEANRALAAMFGYAPSEVIGMHALDFAAPESREVLLREIVSKNESPFELTGLRKDGSTFPVEVCGRAIPYRGRTVTVAALRDLTERKQAEEALQKARDELENRVEREMQRGSSYGLTFRELTVLHLVAAGKADKEIAFELGISPLTASKHLTNILGKMNAASRTEAGVRALREGLLG